MSDALEAAAKAIADKWIEKVDDSTVRVGPVVIARAAILAFIEGLDVEALARAMCIEIADGMPLPDDLHELDKQAARAVLAFLKSKVEP